MRAIWSGAISFGLINIPVKLYSAVQESTLNLDMLDARDHSNIKFKRVNESTGKEVAYDDIVRGYLYKNDYVILDDADFKAADVKKTNTIEIMHFVDSAEIDSLYYEQPYYLAPDKSGIKAYALLRDALAKTGKVGVTSFVLRNRESLAILRPYGKVIVLNKIRFEEEIRDPADLNLPASEKPKPKELEMANKLIEQLTEEFDIAAYKDTYTHALLKRIELKAKNKGKSLPVPKLKVVHKKEKDDLMEMLKASLGSGSKPKGSTKEAPKKGKGSAKTPAKARKAS